MLYADDQNGNKIEATPDSSGFCPACVSELVPKCGQIKIHHWAHKGRRDCDDWYEPETEWHAEWKRQFGKENCEVVMPPHRADIVGKSGVVIELQHSPISPEEIREREDFYKNMVWIVNAHPFQGNLYFYSNPFLQRNGGQPIWNKPKDGELRVEPYFLAWKRLQKRWASHVGASRPTFLDLSQATVVVWNQLPVKAQQTNRFQATPHHTKIIQKSLFRLLNVYSDGVIGGKFVTKQQVIEDFKP